MWLCQIWNSGLRYFLMSLDGYFIDWDYLEKREGLEEKLEQFLELGQSIIKETDGLFPDGLSVLNGTVMMNGLIVDQNR